MHLMISSGWYSFLLRFSECNVDGVSLNIVLTMLISMFTFFFSATEISVQKELWLSARKKSIILKIFQPTMPKHPFSSLWIFAVILSLISILPNSFPFLYILSIEVYIVDLQCCANFRCTAKCAGNFLCFSPCMASAHLRPISIHTSEVSHSHTYLNWPRLCLEPPLPTSPLSWTLSCFIHH